jgi:hypothetical protein
MTRPKPDLLICYHYNYDERENNFKMFLDKEVGTARYNGNVYNTWYLQFFLNRAFFHHLNDEIAQCNWPCTTCSLKLFK